jgi:hypothetical protein
MYFDIGSLLKKDMIGIMTLIHHRSVGFLLDVLNVNTTYEKWWDDNRKTVKALLTTQRNNTIKNIQLKFKGALQ